MTTTRQAKKEVARRTKKRSKAVQIAPPGLHIAFAKDSRARGQLRWLCQGSKEQVASCVKTRDKLRYTQPFVLRADEALLSKDEHVRLVTEVALNRRPTPSEGLSFLLASEADKEAMRTAAAERKAKLDAERRERYRQERLQGSSSTRTRSSGPRKSITTDTEVEMDEKDMTIPKATCKSLTEVKAALSGKGSAAAVPADKGFMLYHALRELGLKGVTKTIGNRKVLNVTGKNAEGPRRYKQGEGLVKIGSNGTKPKTSKPKSKPVAKKAPASAKRAAKTQPAAKKKAAAKR